MPTAARRHDIDAIRVIAFGLLILFHSGMAYVGGDGWDWHVKSSHTAEWLQVPMLFLNRWRMELLFVVSGLALSFLRRGQPPARLAWARTRRLLLPLAFGMAVVVPLQPYCQGLYNHLVEPGFGRFLLRYWSGYHWPAHAFDGWEYGWTWNHLWYLAYLWVYTVILLGLLPLLESRRGLKLRAALTRLRGPGLLFLPALPLILWAQLMQLRFPETHDLFHDWFLHGIYFGCFLYGWWLSADEHLWRELSALRRRSLAWTLGVFGAYLATRELVPDDAPAWAFATIRALRWTYCWLAIAAVLGWAHQHLNRPFRWLPYANEAVFPWYMLHQTLIVGLVWWLLPLHLGPVLEPVLVLGGTLAGIAGLHELIRRSGWLRPLFGLKPLRRGARQHPALPLHLGGAEDLQ